MNEPDIGQAELHLAAIPDEERRDTFRQIPWSLKDCCIGLGVIAIFRVVFYVLSLVGLIYLVYTVGVALWILMFGWMFFSRCGLRIKEICCGGPQLASC